MHLDKHDVPGSCNPQCFQLNIGQRSHQITHWKTWFLLLASVCTQWLFNAPCFLSNIHLFRMSYLGEVVFGVYRMALPHSCGLLSTHGICNMYRFRGLSVLENIFLEFLTAHLSGLYHMWQSVHAPAVLLLQVCSNTGGSWVLYCKASHCINKTSRPELIFATTVVSGFARCWQLDINLFHIFFTIGIHHRCIHPGTSCVCLTGTQRAKP